MTSQAGTNGIPKELEELLAEAKNWYDERDLDAMTPRDKEFNNSIGADLLVDIVETIDKAWGFA